MAQSVSQTVFYPPGLGFFPASDLWRWEVYRQNNYVLGPGKEWTIWDRSASGWLYYVILMTDNPDTRLQVDLHADGRLEIDVSPRDLYELGAVGTNPGIITLYRYDSTNNVYVIGYAPQGGLGVPFRSRAVARIVNPSNTPATIKFLEAWLIILKLYSL